jgi:hypothetical protein
MDAQAIVAVSAAVVGLTQLLKWSPLPTEGLVPLLLVLGLSALGVLLWGYSHEPVFTRMLVWDYFAGWVAVALGAAGIYGFTRAGVEAVTRTGLAGR